MKIPIILANWKSFKNPDEAKKWLEDITIINKLKPANYHENIILCVPFIDIPVLKETLKQLSQGLNFVLGAQNISLEEEKPETGETTVKMIKDYVFYIILGHSERRTNFNETEEMVNKKIKTCQDNGLKTIVCISNMQQLKSIIREFPSYKDFILYEPISAIGSGKIEDAKVSNEMAKKIKQDLKNTKVLYGGSVNAENVKNIVNKEFIDGVAVGGASLNPQSFWEILEYVGRKS